MEIDISKVGKYIKAHSHDVFHVNALFVNSFLLSNNLQYTSRYTGRCSKKECESFLISIGATDCVLTIEELIKLFEFVISPADRIVNGSIYTPRYIRDAIIRKCFQDVEIAADTRIADIACGCGGFLADVAREFHMRTGKSYKAIFKENIFGIDIQEYSIERTKILLSLTALMDGEDEDFEFNLWAKDTLDFDFGSNIPEYKGFDIIVGNPPYVCSRNILEETKNRMKEMPVCSTGHPDLYIPFMKIAADNLKDNGMMGFITVNSFLKSLNGRALRNSLQETQYKIDILDFRGKQIFPRRSTYTCLFFLQNATSENISYAVNDEEDFLPDKQREQILYSTLDAHKGWNLNNNKSVMKMESGDVTIGKICPSRHGIATLSNKTYIFIPVGETDNCYLLKKGDEVYKIEKDICRDIVNSNKLNSDVTLESITEKVIFPYVIQSGRAEIQPEDDFRTHYPNAYQYLLSQRSVLAQRDKGKTDKYPTWYAFGRTQSLVLPRYKLFFPKIANKPLRCILVDNPDLLLYNGMAFVSDTPRRLEILKSTLESQTFWQYVTSNSKPYSSGYYSLHGDNIKNFGINCKEKMSSKKFELGKNSSNLSAVQI